jgi:hypothetical protein
MNNQLENKKGNRAVTIILIIIGLVLCACCCLVVMMLTGVLASLSESEDLFAELRPEPTPAPTPTPVPNLLSCGDTVEGSDSESWRFDGVEGETVVVTVRPRSNGSLDYYTLYLKYVSDEFSDEIVYPDSDLVARVEYTFRRDGRHKTWLGFYEGRGGDYILTLECGSSATAAAESTPPMGEVPAESTPPMREAPKELGTGDVQVTLRWNSNTDLDLHVVDPDGAEIYYYEPSSSSGGQLDVDANADCAPNEMMRNPVENIFWPFGEAPVGTYQVFVDYYADCGNVGATSFTVRVLVDGEEREYSGTLDGQDDFELVTEFTR